MHIYPPSSRGRCRNNSSIERFKNTTYPFLIMLPNGDIQRYGGKAAILNHIRNNTQLPIPPYIVKEAGASLDSVLSGFESMKKPVIVRSSSPYEYGDFEGIFESVRDVQDRFSLERAIERVEGSATSERAKKYAKQNGFDTGEDMHVIIQEQSNSSYCGAMMRHPNNPDLIFITYFSGRGSYQQDYFHFLFDERAQEKGESRVTYAPEMSHDTTRFLVEQYKIIESLKDITSDHSLFVEFGFEPFCVYQARPFKKIETADFTLPDFNYDEVIWSDFALGITPPEGITLPVIRSFGFGDALKIAIDLGNRVENVGVEFNEMDELLRMKLANSGLCAAFSSGTSRDLDNMVAQSMEGWHHEAEGFLHEKPYCLMISSAQRDPYDTDLSVPNMKGLVIGRVESFLVHNLVRLFKQSEVTIGVPILLFDDFFKNTESLSKIRIISNGKEGIVTKA